MAGAGAQKPIGWRGRIAVGVLRRQARELLQKRCRAGNLQPLGYYRRIPVMKLARRRFYTLAEEAIVWYAKDIRLDPIDGYAFMSTGMCLTAGDRPGRYDVL